MVYIDSEILNKKLQEAMNVVSDAQYLDKDLYFSKQCNAIDTIVIAYSHIMKIIRKVEEDAKISEKKYDKDSMLYNLHNGVDSVCKACSSISCGDCKIRALCKHITLQYESAETSVSGTKSLYDLCQHISEECERITDLECEYGGF